MELTTVNIAGCEMKVIGVEGMRGTALFGPVQAYLADIERQACVYLAEHGGDPVGFEIHTTPHYEHAETGEYFPGKMRLVKVLGEWDWPPPMPKPQPQGQVEGGRMKEIIVIEPAEIQTQVDTPIVLDKLFGPAVFWPLRITAKFPRDEDKWPYWLVERLEPIPGVDSRAAGDDRPLDRWVTLYKIDADFDGDPP